MTLRPASSGDEARLLEWRNDPATRESAFSGGNITPDEHRVWFARKLADDRCAILIAEENGRPVAQVRFDRIDTETAEVDIAVSPKRRGRGIGRHVLMLAVGDAPRLLGVTRVRARVKPGNVASLKAFRAAGFTVTAEGADAIELERDAGP